MNDDRIILDRFPDLESEPSPVSDHLSEPFKMLGKAVHEVFDGVAVAPGLFIAASDSKWMWDVSRNIYRFNPVTLHTSETDMFHGIDERMSVLNYAQSVLFFRSVIRRSQRAF